MSAPQLRLAPLEPVKDGRGPQPSPKRALLRGALIVGCVGALATTFTMAVEPPNSGPARWSLAAELGVDESDEAHISWSFDPRGCEKINRIVEVFFWEGRDVRPVEEYAISVGDIEVRHIVTWTWGSGDAESISADFVDALDACVTGYQRKKSGIWTFERIGSAEEQRFGWYESTLPSVEAMDAADAETRKEMSKLPFGGPYQSEGRYAIVNGWLLVGVEASAKNVDIDVRSEVDLDALLDVLVAEVEADPITHEDFDESLRYRRDPQDPSQSPSPTPEPVREASG